MRCRDGMLLVGMAIVRTSNAWLGDRNPSSCDLSCVKMVTTILRFLISNWKDYLDVSSPALER